MSKSQWNGQLYTISLKGSKARREGVSLEACPYPQRYTQRSGFQFARAKAWIDGWECADREIREALNPYDRRGIDE
jgi:ribosome modulation factor